MAHTETAGAESSTPGVNPAEVRSAGNRDPGAPTASPPSTEQQPLMLDSAGGSGAAAGGAGVRGGSGGGCCAPHHPPAHPTRPTLPHLGKPNNIDYTHYCHDTLLNARLEFG